MKIEIANQKGWNSDLDFCNSLFKNIFQSKCDWITQNSKMIVIFQIIIFDSSENSNVMKMEMKMSAQTKF